MYVFTYTMQTPKPYFIDVIIHRIAFHCIYRKYADKLYCIGYCIVLLPPFFSYSSFFYVIHCYFYRCIVRIEISMR